MTVLAALSAFWLLAGQPADGNPAAAAAEPTIDSLLEDQPISEDARETAVRAAFDAAQARRGALDGRWRLSAGDGRTLYIFQFADPGRTPDPRSSSPSVPVVEGAWRDPRRAGLPDSSGFLAGVERSGAALTVRFQDADHPRIVTLRPGRGGDWAGTLEGEAPAQAVVMTRF
jgi:hypothetical protein